MSVMRALSCGRCFSLFGVVHQLVDDEASVEMVTADVIQEFYDDGAAL